MKQDLFNSIAAGNLPLLAINLFPARDIPDRAIRLGTCLTYRCAAVSRDVTYDQWTALLANIAQLAKLCAQPHAAKIFRSIGVRRPRTVVIDLAREYAYAWDVAESNGLVLSAAEVLRVTRTRPVNDQLAAEFRALADTYRLVLQAMAPANGNALFRWLSESASVHIAQAQAVQAAI
ncbi:MAG: hypothetical protein ABIQ70_03255 [Dokdonella sp.]